LALSVVPTTFPGGNPVIAVPRETPRSPLMTVRPVFVTVVATRTPKVAAVPKLIACAVMRAGRASVEVRRKWNLMMMDDADM
jgi:hypothetical protein